MRILLFLLVFTAAAAAQVEIFGLRTFANEDEYRPPIISAGERITIEFDVATALPPNLHILFRHANREWIADENVLVNDPAKIRADVLSFTAASSGVSQYTYRYRNSFPNQRNFAQFPFSGHYLFTIVDHDNGDRVLAAGRFIVAESTVPVTMSIENRYHSEFTSPLNQRLFVSVTPQLPANFTAGEPLSVDHTEVHDVAVIRNWELHRPAWIGRYDDSPETFIENLLSPVKTFWRRDILPGNEYRRMDLSSPAEYPNNRLAVLRGGPDVSRYLWQGKPDANGASKIRAFTGPNAEYLETELRLRLPEQPRDRIYAVGSFTGWELRREYELRQDSLTGLYRLRFWLPRGVYDYHYVLGRPEPDGSVTLTDASALEGNDWRTINRYTALVYYRDPRYGGVDRVIGHVRGRNAGTSDPNRSLSVTNPPIPDTLMPAPVNNQSKE